jgi:EAL domain-containing protein (putative c-di-GMP-specific phosphodiesterase class I)/FixJ family two-component response regulator
MNIGEIAFLVAEDNEFQRTVVVRLLERLGARKVHQAADGQSALAIVEDPACLVNIVISDLDMPGMDGMEFIRRLGQIKANVAVILASSLDRELLRSIETMTEAYGVELLGVIEKPLTPGKLDPLIGAYLPASAAARAGPAAVHGLEEIRDALHDAQFEPFFQPKVDFATRQIVGAEALARWRHPEQGILAPYTFIPQMEESGLVDDLTWLMVSQAAASCNAWRSAGLQATVSVNLSLKSLGDTRLAERITELVRTQALAPKYMVLEITESAATTDLGKALENLARLRMKGFELSIDDYGTGYSSMQQLTRIAFTELKIDKSFVAGAGSKKSTKALLESSLEIARRFKLRAVAEGVETQDDWNLLRELSCDLAQGYLLAKPMEGEAFLPWAISWGNSDQRQLITAQDE